MSLGQRLFVAWLGNFVAIAVAVWAIGDISTSGFGATVIAGLVFGIVNAVVKPVLKVLGLPLIVLTLGVALFFINMAMLALTAWIVPGIEVGGFWSVAKGTIVIWAVNVALELMGLRKRRR
jgi:putative membrane protein